MKNLPNKSKRIVYIWPENLKYWEKLENKSEVVNKHLVNLQAELPGQTDLQTELQRKLKEIDERAGINGSSEQETAGNQ